MNKLIVLLLVCSFTELAFGQKADFKKAEKFRRAASEVGSLSVQPHFLKDKDQFWFSYRTSDGTQWYWVDPAKKIKRLLFDNEYMAQELTKITTKP